MMRQKMHGREDWISAALIFLATFAVFVLSPVRTVYDSRFAMLFSQQLLWQHSFSLESRAFPALQSRKPGQQLQRTIEYPYQLLQVGERFYHIYPPGTDLLSMPYVALANAFGISALDQNGMHDEGAEERIQRGLASLLMAALSAIIFFTSRLLLSLWWSLLIAAAAAFGTQIWSTASRALWSHSWGILVLGFVIWLLVRADAKRAPLRPVLLATCLSWLYFVRPPFSLSIGAVALYVLIYHRESLLPFVLTGCLWLGAFIGFSQYHYGHLLPPYYQGYRADSALMWEQLAGVLISPSRGLFIFVPVLAFVAYLLLRYRKSLRPRLVVLAVSVVLAHLILVSGFYMWHGGHCYGPRLITDVVPWLALLSMLALQARLKWRDQNRARDSLLRVRTEWSFALVLLVAGITLNGIGAIWLDALRWNFQPTNIDYDRKRLWDWRHPQFLGVPRDPTTPVR